jgi:UDP-perosamine 4-acetyltransferase
MINNGCILIGAGGHAKVVIEILHDQGVSIAYCIGATDQTACLGIPVLAGDEHIAALYNQGYRNIFIAIGDNVRREKLALAAQELGYELLNAISPKAIVSPSATLGKGIAIMAGAVINAESSIEDFCIINTGAVIDHDCQIGQSAHIAPQCALAGNVTVGAKTFLGVASSVIPGIKIGDSVLVGAGSLVIRDVPAGSRAYGSPAKIISSYDE